MQRELWGSSSLCGIAGGWHCWLCTRGCHLGWAQEELSTV